MSEISYFVAGAVVGGGATIAAAIIRAWWSEKIKRDGIREKKSDKLHAAKYRMYSDLVVAYNETKKFRRVFRAKGICKTRDDSGRDIRLVIRSVYDNQMPLLIDTQLKLEFYRRYVKSNFNVFEDVADVDVQLESALKYLGEIIDEYEDSWEYFAGEPPVCPVSKLDKLEKCLLPFRESKEYAFKFKEPFRSLLETLDRITLAS